MTKKNIISATLIILLTLTSIQFNTTKVFTEEVQSEETTQEETQEEPSLTSQITQLAKSKALDYIGEKTPLGKVNESVSDVKQETGFFNKLKRGLQIFGGKNRDNSQASGVDVRGNAPRTIEEQQEITKRINGQYVAPTKKLTKAEIAAKKEKEKKDKVAKKIIDDKIKLLKSQIRKLEIRNTKIDTESKRLRIKLRNLEKNPETNKIEIQKVKDNLIKLEKEKKANLVKIGKK